MRIRKPLHAVVLLLAALPLLGAPCTEEKIVDVVIGFTTTLQLIASGSTNTFTSTGTVDLKSDLDLATELSDAGVDAATLTPGDIQIAQVFYRVTQPDVVANRTITNGNLQISRLDDGTGLPLAGADHVALATGWSGPAGTGNVPSTTAWTDITADLSPAGVAILNQYVADLIAELQGGAPAVNTMIQYDVSGDSTPTNQATSFHYEVKILFQGAIPQEYEVPFG